MTTVRWRVHGHAHKHGLTTALPLTFLTVDTPTLFFFFFKEIAVGQQHQRQQRTRPTATYDRNGARCIASLFLCTVRIGPRQDAARSPTTKTRTPPVWRPPSVMRIRGLPGVQQRQRPVATVHCRFDTRPRNKLALCRLLEPGLAFRAQMRQQTSPVRANQLTHSSARRPCPVFGNKCVVVRWAMQVQGH